MMFCGCDSDSDFGSDFQSDFESDSEPDSQLLVEIYQSRWMGYRKFFLTLILTTLRRVEGEYQYYYCTSTVQVLYKYCTSTLQVQATARSTVLVYWSSRKYSQVSPGTLFAGILPTSSL